MSKIILSASGLTVGYAENRKSSAKIVHDNISFSLKSGALTSLLGANGAGKSTLIKSLTRFIDPISGQIELMGAPLESYSRGELSRLISVVLTDRVLDSNLSVRDLISLGRYPYTGFFGRLNAQDMEIVEHSAELTGVADMLSRDVAMLSDGERQKIFIAKSLAQQTPLIILDEPTAFLDIKSRIEIMSLLHSLAQRQDKAILISTHDMDAALKLSDRLWVVKKGYGMRCGQTEDMVLSGAMDDIFDREDIGFDIDRATFTILANNSKRTISIDGHTSVVPWIRASLERIGYRVVPSDAQVSVFVREIGDYCVRNSQGERVFSSVEELVVYLR